MVSRVEILVFRIDVIGLVVDIVRSVFFVKIVNYLLFMVYRVDVVFNNVVKFIKIN